ncbi:MAG: hypothetical protein LBH36_01480 [Candidatus Nomurabacteria bacterium]|jgi:hypothetical protein|nr:hypothetical protein [Candidatus Nomurabacteria bacterium]
MGLLMKQEHERSKLQEKIAAELREKATRTSLVDNESPDMVEDSAYQENTRLTRSTAWAWLILFLVIVVSVVFIFVQF